jgi:O-antigen ligase
MNRALKLSVYLLLAMFGALIGLGIERIPLKARSTILGFVSALLLAWVLATLGELKRRKRIIDDLMKILSEPSTPDFLSSLDRSERVRKALEAVRRSTV